MGRSPQRYPTTTKVESHEAWREHLAVSPATSPQAIPMAAHAEQPVHPRQPDCHALMASVTGPAAPAPPAYEVARPWWRRLWALGAARRRRCVVPRAALRPAEPLTAPDGRRRTSQAQRPPPASAGCGPGRVGRQDCPGPGPTGLWPLDVARVGGVWHDGRVLARAPDGAGPRRKSAVVLRSVCQLTVALLL